MISIPIISSHKVAWLLPHKVNGLIESQKRDSTSLLVPNSLGNHELNTIISPIQASRVDGKGDRSSFMDDMDCATVEQRGHSEETTMNSLRIPLHMQHAVLRTAKYMLWSNRNACDNQGRVAEQLRVSQGIMGKYIPATNQSAHSVLPGWTAPNPSASLPTNRQVHDRYGPRITPQDPGRKEKETKTYAADLDSPVDL